MYIEATGKLTISSMSIATSSCRCVSSNPRVFARATSSAVSSAPLLSVGLVKRGPELLRGLELGLERAHLRPRSDPADDEDNPKHQQCRGHS